MKGVILSNIPGFFTNDTKYLNSLLDSLDLVVRHQTTRLPKFAKSRAQVDSISKGYSLKDMLLSKSLEEQYSRANDSLFARPLYYRKSGKLPEPLIRNFRHAHNSMVPFDFNPFDTDYKSALQNSKLPTLLLGAKNDFVKPSCYKYLKEIMVNAKVDVYICPNGAHFPMWDDTKNYFNALRKFILKVEKNSIQPKRNSSLAMTSKN